MSIEIQATTRTEVNPRKLRREGYVPAVIYGKDLHHSVQIPSRDLQKALSTATRSSRFEVKVDGNTFDTFLREVQYHPLNDDIVHIDFYQPNDTQSVTMEVPIRLSGTPIGLKMGGVLSQVREYLPVRGLRADIPAIVDVDVSGMDVGGVLRLGDLPIENVSILLPLDSTIATVKVPRRLALELKEGEEGAEEEATTEETPESAPAAEESAGGDE